MAEKIPTRSEQPKAYTWATEDIYASDEAWQADFDKVPALIDETAAARGKMSQGGKEMYEYFKRSDEINSFAMKLYQYAGRKNDEDTKNPKYQAMIGSVYTMWAQLSAAASYVLPELLSISDDTLAGFYRDYPDLEHYRRHITRMRVLREHVLSEAEEKLLAMGSKALSAPDVIFGVLNDSDLTFPSIKDSHGDELPVTHGSYGRLIESSDRNVRKAAFESMYSVYEQFRNTTAAILDSQMSKVKYIADARKYGNTLQAAIADTEVPESVYHTLIDAVNENIGAMHRYVRLRKKCLGVDELHFYDLYVSMVPDVDVKIPYEEAQKNVYDALAVLGPAYQSALKEGFDNRWIDVYENEGKRSGAYSAGSGEGHPYVLLNHNGTLDSEFTLAHEMGHALHSYHSNKKQPPVYRDYPIFLAEIASTCNEALLMQYLLKKTTDRQQKAYLINHFLEGFKGTLFRQTMFAEFELAINELVASGQTLTAEAMSAMYKDLNIKYFGPDIVVDPQIELEWSRIPHFYYNYYVYQYATGYSAAIALSSMILSEGDDAVDRYIEFLSAGGSDTPLNTLKKAGVDMSTKAPIAKALAVFEDLVGQMEELTK